MQFIPIWSYDNYVSAQIALGRLQEDGIDCWLKDENTVTIDPILANAVGGIKLMVVSDQAGQALDILNSLQAAHKASLSCPYCKSHKIKLVSSPRKPLNWISAISTFFFSSYALTVEKNYHCFNCKKEFTEPISSAPDDEDSFDNPS
jgi:DNA-directed RNA polymerase subunit RPC12/RpoP